MSHLPEALYLSVSPSLQRFNRPLINTLSQSVSIGTWEYCQTPDEPTSLEVALVLLHDYLKHLDHPLHLIGHGTSGLLGLLYARRYPERVRSLTLLAVGFHAAIDWQAYYYHQLQTLPCSREILLTQMVRHLFGSHAKIRHLIHILEQDLFTSPSPHSLFNRSSMPPVEVSVPLLACGSVDDLIIDTHQLHGWQHQSRQRVRIWECSSGRHFFHYFCPQEVSDQILLFFNSSPSVLQTQSI